MARLAAASRRWQSASSVQSTSLAPGAAWNGTAGSGAAAPTLDTTLQGISGFVEKAIAGFDEPKFAYLTQDLQITVMADTGDSAWIKQVDFYFEGSQLTINQLSQSARTGAIGFACVIKPSLFSVQGDANLYAIVTPYNGYKRMIGPLQICNLPDVSRPFRYLDPAGSDASNGLTPGTAWKTVSMGFRNAPSSAIIQMAAGTYLEDANPSSPNPTPARPVEFRAAPGTNLGDVVISRTTRGTPELSWNVYNTQVMFRGVQIDTHALPNVLGRSPGNYFFYNCNLINPYGGNGPPEGYNYQEIQQTVLKQGLAGQTQRAYHALCECTFTNPPTTGWMFCRGTQLNTGWDAVFIDHGNYKDMVVLNTVATKVGSMEQRQHLPLQLTVSSVTYDGANNRTTFGWSGSPTLFNLGAGQTDQAQRVRFFTGGMVGNELVVYAQDSALFTTTVAGDGRAAAIGDTAKVYGLAHSDSLQFGQSAMSDTNWDNIIFQKYRTASGPGDNNALNNGFQPMLYQAGNAAGAGTISTVGTALTCSVAHGLQVGDFVVKTPGLQQEYHQVATVVDATRVTLDVAFAVDLTTATWQQAKSVQNMALQLCIFASPRTPPSNNAQVWNGTRHLVWRQCTYYCGDLQWRTDQSSFAALQDYFQDNIIYSSLTTPFPIATAVIADHNHWATGTVRGTNTGTGATTFDTNWRVVSGVTLTTTPKLPWNYLGETLKLNGTDLVGALG